MRRRVEQWSMPFLTDIEISQFLTCCLCKGYKIDCTALLECHHSFCRTCIVSRLRNTRRCPFPRCGLMMSITPFKDLQEDNQTQNIIYQVVPGLRLNEGLRREQFWEANPILRELHLDAVNKDMELLKEYPDSQIKRVPICLKHLGILEKKLNSKSIWKEIDSPFKKLYLRLPNSAPIGVVQQLIREKFRVFNNQYDPWKIEVIFISDLNIRALRHDLTIEDAFDAMSNKVESMLYYSVFLPMTYYKSIPTNTASSMKANSRQVCLKSELNDLNETALNATESGSELTANLSEETNIQTTLKPTKATGKTTFAVQETKIPSNTTTAAGGTETIAALVNLRKAFADTNCRKRKIIPGQSTKNHNNETSANKKPRWDVSDFISKQNRLVRKGPLGVKGLKASSRIEETVQTSPDITVSNDVENQNDNLKPHEISRTDMEPHHISAEDKTPSVSLVSEHGSVVHQHRDSNHQQLPEEFDAPHSSAIINASSNNGDHVRLGPQKSVNSNEDTPKPPGTDSTSPKLRQSMLTVDIGQRAKNKLRFSPRHVIDNSTQPQQNKLRNQMPANLVMAEDGPKQIPIQNVTENTDGSTHQRKVMVSVRDPDLKNVLPAHPLNQNIRFHKYIGSIGCMSGAVRRPCDPPSTSTRKPGNKFMSASSLLRKSSPASNRLPTHSRLSSSSKKNVDSEKVIQQTSARPNIIFPTAPAQITRTTPVTSSNNTSTRPIQTGRHKFTFRLPMVTHASIPSLLNYRKNSKQHSLPQSRVPNVISKLTNNPVHSISADGLTKQKIAHGPTSVNTSISIPGKSIGQKPSYNQQLNQYERIGRAPNTETEHLRTTAPNTASLNQQSSRIGDVTLNMTGIRNQAFFTTKTVDDNAQSPQNAPQYVDLVNDPNDEDWKVINSEISIGGVYSVAQHSAPHCLKDIRKYSSGY